MENKDAIKWWGLYVNGCLVGVKIWVDRPSIGQFGMKEDNLLNSTTIEVVEVKVEKK